MFPIVDGGMPAKNNQEKKAKCPHSHVDLKHIKPEMVFQWPPLNTGGRDVFLVMPFSSSANSGRQISKLIISSGKTGKNAISGGNEESDFCFSVVKALQCQLMDFQICKSDCP